MFEVERTNRELVKKRELQTFAKAFRSAVRRAKLHKRPRKLRFHDAGRHTFISAFNEANPGCVSERMRLAGHRGPGRRDESGTTRVSERYTHVELDALRPFLEKLAWFFPENVLDRTAKKA